MFQEETVVLEPGDWLIVFSDGVSEAMSANGDEYGEERILAVVDSDTSLAPADLLKALFADVRAFTKAPPERRHHGAGAPLWSFRLIASKNVS